MIDSRKYSSAFTLIELVISSALASIILVSAYLCLSAGLSSQKMIESRAEAGQNARVAMAIISADLRAACPLSDDFEFVGMHRTLGETEADNLDFATHHYTPSHPREGDYCQVSFFLDKNPDSGKLSLWRRRNPGIALDPLSGGNREEIARDVAGLRFDYYDGFDWFDAWGEIQGRPKEKNSSLTPRNRSGMPEAVRITLWFFANTRSEPELPQDKSSKEPPLAFQTVVRLELASASERGGAGTGSGEAGPESSGQPNPKTRTPGRN